MGGDVAANVDVGAELMEDQRGHDERLLSSVNQNRIPRIRVARRRA